MKTQAYKWKPYTELLNWKKSEICWKFEMENHDTTLWFSFVWSQKKSSERNLQKGVSIIQGASCGRRRDNQLHSWAARSVRYDLNYCTSTHLIPVPIWCKHRWKDSQRFHSYTCADFIPGRREKTFFTGMNETTGFVFVFHFLRRRCWVCPGHNHTRASILIKHCEFCASFCVLYSNFRWESNETEVKMIFFYRALSWAKKICTNSEPLKRKKKAQARITVSRIFLDVEANCMPPFNLKSCSDLQLW